MIVQRADGRVLIGKRIGAHGKNTWAFPGGRLEFGESWEACALRELEEETGLVVNTPQFVGATNDVHLAEGRHYITIFMHAHYKDGEPEAREPHKCLVWEWHPWDALPRPLFLAVENLISQGFHPDHHPVLTTIEGSATLAPTFSP